MKDFKKAIIWDPVDQVSHTSIFINCTVLQYFYVLTDSTMNKVEPSTNHLQQIIASRFLPTLEVLK